MFCIYRSCQSIPFISFVAAVARSATRAWFYSLSLQIFSPFWCENITDVLKVTEAKDRFLSQTISTKPHQCSCITTTRVTDSGRVESKWNMATIICSSHIRVGSKMPNGATAADWCGYEAFVGHPVTVTASVDLIQFYFQLPVVYNYHSHCFCGINHPSGPCGCSRQAPHWVM